MSPRWAAPNSFVNSTETCGTDAENHQRAVGRPEPGRGVHHLPRLQPRTRVDGAESLRRPRGASPKRDASIHHRQVDCRPVDTVSGLRIYDLHDLKDRRCHSGHSEAVMLGGTRTAAARATAIKIGLCAGPPRFFHSRHAGAYQRPRKFTS